MRFPLSSTTGSPLIFFSNMSLAASNTDSSGNTETTWRVITSPAFMTNVLSLMVQAKATQRHQEASIGKSFLSKQHCYPPVTITTRINSSTHVEPENRVSDRSSFPRNQVIYRVGRKTSVRMVATNNPPMIANAIGPQNTVGAIGINPSTVEIAVSMIGRKRDRVASTTASQICGLCARSV